MPKRNTGVLHGRRYLLQRYGTATETLFRPKIRSCIHRQLGQPESLHICQASFRTGKAAAGFGMLQVSRHEPLTDKKSWHKPAWPFPAMQMQALPPCRIPCSQTLPALSGRILPVGRMEGRNS